jgi:hypothetical protein
LKVDAPKTPNCDRLATIGVGAVRDFCEFLNDEGLAIVPRRVLAPLELRAIDVVYKWAGIDAKELENERRALLEWQRNLNGLDKDGCLKEKAAEAETAASESPTESQQPNPSPMTHRKTKSSSISTPSSKEQTG